MISLEQVAEILRLFHAEKWAVGTIAAQFQIHHDTVQRVIDQEGTPLPLQSRSSIIDSFVPFILEVLKKFPSLPASRLYAMCRERGYRGRPDHFRHRVALIRPRPAAEAYLRLRTLPGEQAQVDWAHFGKITIGRAERQLMAFVMVLSYSRAVFLRFFLSQVTENFLRGHVAAFEEWGGVPRVLLYDNLKSAVIERRGDAIRFNDRILKLAGFYRFEPRPVAPARGNEKGRVERAIQYARTSFFPARQYRDLDDLNRQAFEWCHGIAMERRWQEDDRRTVEDAYEEERQKLMSLPPTDFETDERKEVSVGKSPYVRFDGNDYSVPHEHVRQTVVVLASTVQVRVIVTNKVVACHPRSYDRRQQIEDPVHIDRLKERKAKAHAHRGMDRLISASRSCRALLSALAERGASLGGSTAKLLRLLDAYGAAAFDAAVVEALRHDTPHPHAVQQILDQRHRGKGLAPPVPVQLPDNPRVRDLTVQPHSLSDYDQISHFTLEDTDGDASATLRS